MRISLFHRVVGSIMNLISGIHHSCKKREYTIICIMVLLNNHSWKCAVTLVDKACMFPKKPLQTKKRKKSTTFTMIMWDEAYLQCIGWSLELTCVHFRTRVVSMVPSSALDARGNPNPIMWGVKWWVMNHQTRWVHHRFRFHFQQISTRHLT